MLYFLYSMIFVYLPIISRIIPMKKAKLVIIGSGPAGYTAAIYAARANLEPILYEGFFSGPSGGQLMTTTEVENFPGFPEGITGPALMEAFRKQALRFGTHILRDDVESVDFSKAPLIINGKEHAYYADAVILATGATANRLDIPGTRDGEFWQKGVTACAVCDGAMPIFRDKKLYVIGGGDSAVEEATFLTKFASKVYLVHRRDKLRASKIMQERALNHPKIEILWDSEIVEVTGENVVQSVTLKNLKTLELTTQEAGGVFFAVGHTPNTKFLQGQIKLHDNGYIAVKPGTTQTSHELVFAAGDAQDHVYRQAITAAGTGCMAAIEAERELSARGLGV
ncbi:Thioredoxin reductase [Neochlamydia sp. EPS4]|nr:Thioredoxin reductase [Neochlamydia sp. EPS4]